MEGARSETDIWRLGGLLEGGVGPGGSLASTTPGGEITAADAMGGGAAMGTTTGGGGTTGATAAGGTIPLSGSIGLIELVEPRGVIEGVFTPSPVREASKLGGRTLGTSMPRSLRLISLQAMLNSLMFILPSESVSARALRGEAGKQKSG